MPQERQQLPLIAVLSKLHLLCKNRRSGVMSMTTPDGRQILFRLRKGAIIDVSHEGAQGLAALASVGEVKQGSLIFKDEEVKRIHDLKVLPSTKDILFLLGLPLERLNIAPLAQYDLANRAEWTMDRLKTDTGRIIPLSDLVEMIRFSQTNHLSAILFFITAERQWFEFVIKGGEINDVTSRAVAGLAAVRAFKGAKGAKYSIRLRRCSEPTDYRQIQPLPSMGEILLILTTPAKLPGGDEPRAFGAASEGNAETSRASSSLRPPSAETLAYRPPTEMMPGKYPAPESAPSEEPEIHRPPPYLPPSEPKPEPPPHPPASQPASTPQAMAAGPRARTSREERRRVFLPYPRS